MMFSVTRIRGHRDNLGWHLKEIGTVLVHTKAEARRVASQWEGKIPFNLTKTLRTDPDKMAAITK